MKEEQKACIDCHGIVCVQLPDRRVMGSLRTQRLTELSLPISKCPLRRNFNATDWDDIDSWFSGEGKTDTKNLGS